MTDQELFFRDFDRDNMISSGTKYLEAAAARFFESWLASGDYLEDTFYRRIQEIFDPETLWIMSLVIAAWIAMSIVGGPVGGAVNAVIFVIGVYELFERIKEIGNDLIEFAQKSFYASKRQDLEDAGKALADFFVLGGITLVETLVLSRAFKFARTAIAKKFPLPKTLRERFSRRKIERAERRRRREQLKDKLLEANLQNPALVLEGSKRLTKEIDEAGFPLVLGLGMLAVSVTSGLLLMKALDDGKSK